MTSPYFTLKDMCDAFGCHKTTILRKVESGELPEFTIGANGDIRGWHLSVLESHALKKAELSEYFSNAS